MPSLSIKKVEGKKSGLGLVCTAAVISAARRLQRYESKFILVFIFDNLAYDVRLYCVNNVVGFSDRKNLNSSRGGRLKLTDEIKEEIEASIWYNFSYGLDIPPSDMVKYVKEIAAPAIFKILEKGE